MTSPRLPRRVLITGVLGVATLGGVGAAAVAHAATGSALPVLNIKQAAATDDITNTLTSTLSNLTGQAADDTTSTTAAPKSSDDTTTSTTTKPAAGTGDANDMKNGCDHDGDGKPDGRGPRGEHAPLDDATAAKVKSAALAAVPGATVDHVGHDRGDGYIAMLTKSDGTTHVLVHEDKNFNVTKTEDPAPARGPGHGGPGHGGPRPDGSRPAKPGTNSGEGTGSAS